MVGHVVSPGFLNADINTPEILKLMAKLSAILARRDHRSLTSAPSALHANNANIAGLVWAAPDRRG